MSVWQNNSRKNYRKAPLHEAEWLSKQQDMQHQTKWSEAIMQDTKMGNYRDMK